MAYLVSKQCDVCGKTFIGRKRQTCCSKMCGGRRPIKYGIHTSQRKPKLPGTWYQRQRALGRTHRELVRYSDKHECLYCKKEFYNNKKTDGCCSVKCAVENRKIQGTYTSIFKSGEEHPYWLGGRIKTGQGYIKVKKHDHPYADKGGYVLEHRLIMEDMLGIILDRKVQVHHKNGIRDDNRRENLEIVTYSNHFGEVKCPCGCGFVFKIK